MSVATGQAHLVLDLSDEQRELFSWAASKQGLTLEEFAIALLEAAAEDMIRGDDSATVRISSRAYRQLLEALDSPPEPNENLRAAFERYRKLVGE
jgi:uncharacterized protein (DUF1778 family)